MADTIYFQDGTTSTYHAMTSPDVNTTADQVRQAFPAHDVSQHIALNTAFQHEVYNETFIRGCLSPSAASILLGREVVTAHRGYLMTSHQSYYYVLELFTGEQPSWCPDQAFVGGVYTHIAEAGHPAPDINAFTEYFMFASPQCAHDTWGFPIVDDMDGEVYSCLISPTNEVLAARRYYDPDFYWDPVFIAICRKYGRRDLIRAFMEKELY